MTGMVRFACLAACLLVQACSEKPLENTARPHTPSVPSMEAVDSSPGTIVVELLGPSEGTVLFEGPNGLSLALRAPAIACSMPAGTWSIQASAPGHQQANRTIDLQPQGSASVVISMMREPTPPSSRSPSKGLIFNGEELSPTTALRLSDFRTPGSLSLSRSLSGKKLVERRQYDGEPVASLAELQWKIRGVIIHAFKANTPQKRLEELLALREGRHFLISAQGDIHQLTDLANQVAVLDRYHDRTTVHVGLQIPLAGSNQTASSTINGQPTTMPTFTEAQHASLKDLLAELNHHLPRIHLKTPTLGNGPSSEAIPWPRLFRGVLARFHVDPTSVLPGPGLDFGKILPPTSKDAPQPGESNEQALWVKGPTQDSKLLVTGPQSAKVVGTHNLVFCRPPLGRWRAESIDKLDRRVSGVIDVASENLSVLALTNNPQGALVIEDAKKRTALVTGPHDYSKKIPLPATLNGLMEGTYRVSLPSVEVGQKWAVRVEEGKRAKLVVPSSPLSASAIIIAGKPFVLDANVPVVTFESRRGHSFYRAQEEVGDKERLFEPRKGLRGQEVKDLDGLKDVVRMAVLHADVLDDIETAFHVLHSKGLSSHFGVDFDGTIYQMLDPVHVAFGAAEVNPISIQIDLNNRMHNLVKDPKAPPYPRDHRNIRKMQRPTYKRPLSDQEIINEKPYRAYGYTDAQYRSLVTLLRTLSGVFEEIELDFPAPSSRGHHQWADAYEDFRGIVAHFHLTPRRWDPGPGFDWKRLREALGGRTLIP